MKQDQRKRGYTMIEVMLSILLSFGVVATVLVVPNQMIRAYQGYMEEAAYSQANSQLLLAIREDTSRQFLIEEEPDGFSIGPNRYLFSEEGVFRRSGGSDVQLTDLPLLYHFDGDTLHVESRDAAERAAEEQTVVRLAFPVRNSANISEGVVSFD